MKAALLTVSAIVGCMEIPRDDKIVGGSLVTDTREVPYMTRIDLKDPKASPEEAFWCPYSAGTILSQLYVVTACQNVVETDEDGEMISMIGSYPLKNWQFVAGNADSPNEWAQFRTPVSLQFHPKCQIDPYLYYDVAVAKMSEPFIFNDFVKPVKFIGFEPKPFKAHVDNIIASQGTKKRLTPSTCVISGWGSTLKISIVEHFGGIQDEDEEESITPGVKIPSLDILRVIHFGTPEDEETYGALNDTGNGKLKPAERREEEECDDFTAELRSLLVYPMNDKECLIKLMKSLKEGIENSSDANLKKEALFADYSNILFNQICTLSRFNNESSCLGDPGSGLICDGYLIGVISWSIGCGTAAPEIIQSLPELLDWMKDEVCTLRHYNDADYLHPNCQTKKKFKNSKKKKSSPSVVEPEQARSAVKKSSIPGLAIILQILVPISQK